MTDYHKSLSHPWAFALSPPSAWSALAHLGNSNFWFRALVRGQGLRETLPWSPSVDWAPLPGFHELAEASAHVVVVPRLEAGPRAIHKSVEQRAPDFHPYLWLLGSPKCPLPSPGPHSRCGTLGRARTARCHGPPPPLCVSAVCGCPRLGTPWQRSQRCPRPR